MLPRDLRMLIRADVGPRIGTGHLMRCLALGQAWNSIGGQVAFACGPLPGILHNRLTDEGFAIYAIENPNGDELDARNTCEVANVFEPDWVVLDGYRFDDNYQSNLRSLNSRFMVVDDWGHGLHEHADAILNQNTYASAESFQHLNEERLLMGSRYSMLRNEFSKDQLNIEEKLIAKTARRILVTFGGSDPDNTTLRVLHLLDSLGKSNLVVDVVIGANYQQGEALQEFKKLSNLNLRIHRNIDRISSLMSKVDIAISGGGSTCYELARCGIPSLLITIAENQKPIAKALDDKGVAISCGHFTDLDESTTASKLRLILRDSQLRRSMSNRGRQLIDGRGSYRIARYLASRLYRLCDASQHDFDLLFDLRNEPEFRAMSFSPESVSPDSYRAWLHGKLTSEGSLIWIAHFKDGPPIGCVCVDYDYLSGVAKISICLQLSERGKGHGSSLINQATRKIFSRYNAERIIAQIKHGMPASQCAFRNAGYRPIVPTVVKGQTALQMTFDRNMLDGDALPTTQRWLKSA